tara:strand:+ start:763 stop:915 length:153 start_codon:yes stop_codon:yes gene_type:complete
METLYTLQQFETQGWVTIATNLIKEDAKNKLDALIADGMNPKDLKLIKER